MDRRALLAGSAAGLWAASARAQQACFNRLDCFDTQLPGPSLDLQFTAGTLDPRITFARADATSCATYFNAAGALTTVAANVARFDYDPVTHAAKGLLIEEARTNLLLNSATLGTQSVTTAATPYTLSFYGTGTVTLTGTSTAGPLTGSGAFPQRVSLTFTPTAGTLTLTVSGSVLNANLEAGSFATSAIVTAGASVTRAADVATMPTGSWFNQTAGTLLYDVGGLGSTSSPVTLGGFGSNNGFADCFYVAFNANTVAVTSTITAGGGGATGSSAIAPLTPFRFATSWTAIQIAQCLSGGSVLSAASTMSAVAMVRLAIGQASWTNGNTISGPVRRVRYWPRALSGPELQAVTR